MPAEVFAGTEDMQRGFLQALFTADGGVQGSPKKGISVRLAQSNERLLEQVQMLLLNFGISNRIYRNRREAGYRMMPDANRKLAPYWTKSQHELVISKDNLLRFQKEIGFLTTDKEVKLKTLLKGLNKRGSYREYFLATFASLEEDGTEEVFDLTVPATSAFVANGLVVHNCGEQCLQPLESCNLGSINLLKFVTEKDGQKEIDWEDLERTVRVAVRFLDDVIDVNPYPLPEVDEAAKANRRIGLGIMGWADLLFTLDIPYDSEEALQLAGKIMGFIREHGHDESAKLAEEREPFPNWSRSIYKDGKPLRNATITTIAPTGSVSIIAGCSSGIEPIFALAFSHVSEERRLTFVNQRFEEVAKEKGFYSPKLVKEVKETGSVQNSDVYDDIKEVFKIAHEIAPEWHVRMQAAFQQHVDNSVSKTVNLPNSATVEDVKDVYRLAYELGCMGITVFRDGCRDEQVLHVGTAKEEPEEAEPKKKRPRMLMGATYKTKTPVGTAYITVNHDEENNPLEVFLNIGKAGSDIAAMAEALGRLISLCLRISSAVSSKAKMTEITGELNGIGGSRSLGFGQAKVLSLPDAIARVLAEHTGVQSFAVAAADDNAFHNPIVTGDLCPGCGHATFVHEEGCYKCYSCGQSEC